MRSRSWGSMYRVEAKSYGLKSYEHAAHQNEHLCHVLHAGSERSADEQAHRRPPFHRVVSPETIKMASSSLQAILSFPPNLTNFIAFLAIVVVGLIALYFRLLPKAIQGIPCNEDSKRSVLGDIPKVAAFVKKYRDPYKWMATQCQAMNSALVQVWIKPGSRPTVICADFREAQDVLIRRTKEFERSDFFMEVFDNTIKHATISMKTDDKFKALRRALADTMSLTFINNVAALQVFDASVTLVELWKAKRELANGRPIPLAHDLEITLFDAMWASVFGNQLRSADVMRKALPKKAELNSSQSSIDEPITFQEGELDPIVNAVGVITHSTEAAISSPLPWLTHWIVCKVTAARGALKYKHQVITERIAESRAKYTAKSGGDLPAMKSVVDCVLRQEEKSLKKGEAGLSDAFLEDELTAFLIGGHETTASVFQWGVKYLSDKPQVQRDLRSALTSGLNITRPDPSSTVLPTPASILETPIPYLDAVIEEMLRMGAVASGISRQATVDTTLLGYPIPKGTEVFFANAGPCYKAPAIPVDESKRSASSRERKGKVGEWDLGDIEEFRPERWLKEDENGLRFDINAGPNMAFSAGIRGCFGKRLAYAEAKLLLTLIVLNFDLKPVPPELRSYDANVMFTRTPQQCYVRLGEVA
ncbi:MAG: hypothetical protein M1822_008742 [Bathelium mastoideum]|nr:MAG: hypothetical protein M1822_008742 [Bathelium mastoideum]